ncbi:hypothetical protein QTP70_001798 [Hemibagrus guttatus]|uniref:Uncharacterized protein n=1 Tax=Hemibagrus guttatus TaxID=175788 RepID=A0AAE0PRG4_9TELE|nr:hypothetical protein QTP70_001798 [Hemibagrus guttatus]
MDTRYNGVHVYGRQTLLEFGNHAPANMHYELWKSLCNLGLLRRPGPESSASPDAGGRESSRQNRCARKLKRGKRAGVHARLKTNPSRPPSILISNVCSLDNKLDYIRLQRTTWHHISFMLIPSYKPLVTRSKPVQKLGNCNQRRYHRFGGIYTSKCIDDVTISKSITTRSNQKLWMTAKVHALLKSRDSTFRAGDKDALRTARAKLSRAIREAKRTHSQRIHGHFQSSGDTPHMWQGIQSIINYRPAPPA